jgi:hypothetical protein
MELHHCAKSVKFIFATTLRESNSGIEHVFRLPHQLEYLSMKRIESAYFVGVEHPHAFQQVLGVNRIDDPSSQG